MVDTRSHGEEVSDCDPEIERTFNQLRRSQEHKLDHPDNEDKLTEGSENIEQQDLEKQESMDLEVADPPVKTLKEYSTPTFTTSPSCITMPEVAANSFELKTSMLGSLPKFSGTSDEDPNMHIREFFDMCGTIRIHQVNEEVVRLKLLPFSLKDKAKAWLNSLPPNSIDSWETLATKFLQKYFPAQKTNRMRREIMQFTQGEQEPFYETWERFQELLHKCPHHGITDWMQMHFFYEGLTSSNKSMVDSACGGALMEKTPQAAFEQFDLLANNNQQWGSGRTTRRAGVYEVDVSTGMAAKLSSLEKKFDTLMKVIIPSSSEQVCAICSDPNHSMELCPSTTQGPEHVNQVNSFQRSRNDPYSSSYNPGWRNHPNFSWSNQQQQASSSRPFQQQVQSPSELKKPTLEDLIAQFVQTSQQNQNTMQASIAKLETQVGQLATIVHERAQGTFPSQPEINPRGSEHTKAIKTLRNGRTYNSPDRNELNGAPGRDEDHAEKGNKDDGILPDLSKIIPLTSPTTITTERPEEMSYKPPLPFPHRCQKQKQGSHMLDILEIFKKVQINIPLLQAIQQVPSYAKFLKDACTNKKKFTAHEKVLLTEECSAVLLQAVARKSVVTQIKSVR